MAAKLVRLQGGNGYWPVSLLEPQETPETSGTGFFVYGLAWGVNHGLLPESSYRQSIDRGWHALVLLCSTMASSLGTAYRAQPTRLAPDDTQLYGVGAFLLAASEVSRIPP